MAELPLPSPSGPEGQKPVSPRLVPANRLGKPDAAAIFSMLREAVASGRFEIDMILGAIAEAAQTLTAATGAAVAMRREGVMICRGRSGMTAPSLGAQLSINTGLSGDCLRSGKTLRCDDTEKDYRADPDACRRMGLRSIVAVPLNSPRGSIGILEVFSNRPSAFSDEHVEILDRLAGMAEAAGSREARTESPSTRHAELRSVQSVDEVLFGKAITVDRRTVSRTGQKFWEAIAVLAVLLAGVVAWRIWPQVAPGRSSAGADDLSVGTLLSWKPNAARRPTSKNHKKLTTKSNANTLVPAPLHSDTEKPGGGIATPAQAQTSTSVTDGTLLRKVQPVYPAEAIAQHLEGSVVLQATVAEDGKVDDVTVLHGDPLLARAASDAVRQWQYEPFRADGKPIQKQTEITIEFKAQ